MTKGLCILVEAPDGSGKDTLIDNIISSYPNKHFKVYKFPSGKFREKILSKPRTQQELVPIFCQDFKQTLASIQKDLNNGINIIINRMYISTLLYGLENKVSQSMLLYNIEKAIKDWRPDLTVLLDIDPKEAFKRLASRSDEKNWLDGSFEKQLNINNLYKDFFKINWKLLYPSRTNILQVNSNGSKEQTLNNFKKQYNNWLNKNIHFK